MSVKIERPQSDNWMKKTPVTKKFMGLVLFSIFGERKHSYLFLQPNSLPLEPVCNC